jgi:hypothetical protein
MTPEHPPVSSLTSFRFILPPSHPLDESFASPRPAHARGEFPEVGLNTPVCTSVPPPGSRVSSASLPNFRQSRGARGAESSNVRPMARIPPECPGRGGGSGPANIEVEAQVGLPTSKLRYCSLQNQDANLELLDRTLLLVFEPLWEWRDALVQVQTKFFAKILGLRHIHSCPISCLC